MKKITKGLYLSLACAVSLQAVEVALGTIDIEETLDSEVIKNVSGEEIKSADLAEALVKQSPSVSLVRRSGIANDMIVRGQKKDNINVTVDGTKVYGACPNRMDPPVSHVLTNTIDFIEINEGPYNVEDFGVLSADVKMHTKKPTKEFTGELGANFGSFGYKKGYFTVSGGGEHVRFLLGGSAETGEQYEDGDGNDFSQQQDRYITANPTVAGMGYLPSDRDRDAFTKKMLTAKLFWTITDNQELRLSYTANRSEDLLYPNTPMDADYDDSDIYSIAYRAKNLGAYAKTLSLNLYQSEVDHPMSIQYRKSVVAKGVIKHWLSTKMQGAKLKNSFDTGNHTITTGLDYSVRNWNGSYYKDDNPFPHAAHPNFHSVWDADTQNSAFFIKDKLNLNQWKIDFGLRYDDTTITTARPSIADNEYSGLGGHIRAAYHTDKNSKYFAGIGTSSRVPDARELYLHGKGGSAEIPIGTPNLDKVTNYEADLGMQAEFKDVTVKSKVFYSYLQDYIAFNTSKTSNKFENVDATIWGAALSGSYFATESLYFDYGISYQRGKKENPLTGQSSTNLADISPLKMNLALNYAYDPTLDIKAEVIAADEWRDFDEENGEQALDSYAILNLKATKEIARAFELTVGVDNLFDKTYTVSNTYKDLTLITAGGTDTMLMNEPGRYFYTNIKYTF